MYEAHSINAEHKDLIHDVAYDYYGLRMATCSSDQNIKVWDQDENGKWYLSANWKAHSGSVWKVTWAHPEFGQVIATCSFDRTAVVWEEVGPSPVQAEKTVHQWIRRTNLVDSRTSVTDVKFGPKSLGLVLATCSADGLVRIYEAPDVMNLSQWNLQHEVACPALASCLTWNHSFSRLHPPMIAVGSDDPNPSAMGSKALLLEYSDSSRRWNKTEFLPHILEPVHDIAFAPNLGRSYHLLALATKTVKVVKLKPVLDVMGSRFDIEIIGNLDEHCCTVWRVSWNVTGTIIASSGDDGCVRLWKSHHTEGFRCISVLKADGTQAKLPAASEPHAGSSAGGSVVTRGGQPYWTIIGD
uniref:Nucleoporin SEH1 n=1 Tax=Cacopsylla melanoneura TaxID=428564 RepID=A0A8D8YLQ0_9HEMI